MKIWSDTGADRSVLTVERVGRFSADTTLPDSEAQLPTVLGVVAISSVICGACSYVERRSYLCAYIIAGFFLAGIGRNVDVGVDHSVAVAVDVGTGSKGSVVEAGAGAAAY